MEGPDECGHRAEIENKVKSIELIDQKILAPVYRYLKDSGEDFKIMILPDHPTPIRIRTHSMDAVPFLMYSSKDAKDGTLGFDESIARATNLYIPNGYTLMEQFVEK